MQSVLDFKNIRETAYFKSLDYNFKVGLTIYLENTGKGNRTTLTYLAEVLAEDVDKRNISSAIMALIDWGLIDTDYGITNVARLTSVGNGQFEQNYKELITSKTEEQKRKEFILKEIRKHTKEHKNDPIGFHET